VTDKPPQTKWATGSNLAFVSYAADPERSLVIAMGLVVRRIAEETGSEETGSESN